MTNGNLVKHSAQFRRRRFFNWAPLGLTYAFLYMGRYNLTVAKAALGDLMSLEQFGTIFGVGTAVYAFSFLVNGPLTDRWGGRMAILIAAAGSGTMNLLMGFMTRGFIVDASQENLTLLYSLLYAINMYFQSFGAVAIVKVNSNWFHVKERGTFSAIFGAIISSGIFLAFDVGFRVVKMSEGQGPGGVDATWWVFFTPGICLWVFFIVSFLLVRNLPGEAGLEDFDTGAARLSEDEDKPIPSMELLKKILSNPIILTVAMIEFCTGVLRNGIMHWYPLYAKSTLVLSGSHPILANWGLILMVAGITGGAFAGIVSDKLFQSRRAPAAGGLYIGMVLAVGVMIFSLGGTHPVVGWIKEAPTQATEAGLRSGDLITELDGKPVEGRGRFIGDLREDKLYTLTVLRACNRSGESPNCREEKISLSGNPEVLAKLKLRRNLVTEKAFPVGGEARTVLHWKGAWAYEGGLRMGDRVVSVNGESPADWADMMSRIKKDGSKNRLVLERDGKEAKIEMVYPDYAPQGSERSAKFSKAGPVQKLNPYVLGVLAFFISLCVIGTHGLLSGTATMDFGGKRGAATAVGVIDGFVYLGTAVQSFALGYLTSQNWAVWPVFLFPFTVIGLFFCTRIWHAAPRGAEKAH